MDTARITHDSNRVAGQILLEGKVAVHSHEDVDFLLCAGEQLTVLERAQPASGTVTTSWPPM